MDVGRQLDVSSDYIGYYTDNGNDLSFGFLADVICTLMMMICASLLLFTRATIC